MLTQLAFDTTDITNSIAAIKGPDRSKVLGFLKEMTDQLQQRIDDTLFMRKLFDSLPVPLHKAIYFPSEVQCADSRCFEDHFMQVLRSRVSGMRVVIESFAQSRK